MGCVPAHAAYFSVVELCKEKFGMYHSGHHPLAAASTGAIATVFHDMVMTPMDLIKQRLQLGYYSGVMDCMRSVYQVEGLLGLYRSLPITLFMNMPYGCVMMATNESLKIFLRPGGNYDLSTHLIAGTGAGALASAVTTPLDVIKTRLQTQHISAVSSLHHSQFKRSVGQAGTSVQVRPAFTLPLVQLGDVRDRGAVPPRSPILYRGLVDAAKHVYTTEGITGFYRGMLPRLLTQAPSVAISWATYEEVKSILFKVN